MQRNNQYLSSDREKTSLSHPIAHHVLSNWPVDYGLTSDRVVPYLLYAIAQLKSQIFSGIRYSIKSRFTFFCHGSEVWCHIHVSVKPAHSIFQGAGSGHIGRLRVPIRVASRGKKLGHWYLAENRRWPGGQRNAGEMPKCLLRWARSHRRGPSRGVWPHTMSNNYPTFVHHR